MLGLKLNHVSKKGPLDGFTQIHVLQNQLTGAGAIIFYCLCSILCFDNIHLFNQQVAECIYIHVTIVNQVMLKMVS